MWSIIISGIVALSVPAGEINQKAVRHFKQSFKRTSAERWSAGNTGYRVSFISESVKHVADYSKNGQWRNTIRYYDQSLLPVQIKRNIKVEYLDSEILMVSEVWLGNTLAYFIKIRHEGWNKTIRVVDENMVVVEAFKEL